MALIDITSPQKKQKVEPTSLAVDLNAARKGLNCFALSKSAENLKVHVCSNVGEVMPALIEYMLGNREQGLHGQTVILGGSCGNTTWHKDWMPVLMENGIMECKDDSHLTPGASHCDHPWYYNPQRDYWSLQIWWTSSVM